MEKLYKIIMNFKRPALWVIIATLIVAMLFVIGLSVNAHIDKASKQRTKEQETDDNEKIDLAGLNLENQDDKNNLTFDALRSILQGEKSITWDDFVEYNGSDMGSGLYIRGYPIDEQYYVLVGGASPEEDPWYVRLYNSDTGQYIDLEEEKNIDEFIISPDDR